MALDLQKLCTNGKTKLFKIIFRTLFTKTIIIDVLHQQIKVLGLRIGYKLYPILLTFEELLKTRLDIIYICSKKEMCFSGFFFCFFVFFRDWTCHYHSYK